MSSFKEININDIAISAFDIKPAWMLITASKPDGSANTMTANWGGFGIMWNKNIAWIVVRPQRYTKEFIDSAESFSLTFFNKSMKKELGYLGKVSGRDENKITKAGLTIVNDNNIPYFKEAELVLFAKKLYAQPLKEEFFIDKQPISDWYPNKDFHILYMAEINKVLRKEDTASENLKDILL